MGTGMLTENSRAQLFAAFFLPMLGKLRPALLACVLTLLGCGSPAAPDDAGMDAGALDTALTEVRVEHSLFWGADAGVLDDAQVVSFARLMALAAGQGNGGPLMLQWFHRFSTTAHSERALPAQFIDAVIAEQGADPTQWDLSRLPFKVTGLHNRVDLAALSPTGHCGELRASISSSDVTLQPFHALFLFRQPIGEGDVVAGVVTCEGTARRWVALSGLEGEAFETALRTLLMQGLTSARFTMLETVEFTLAPWEWRQWVPAPDGGLENPPLFQQLDVEKLNLVGPSRTEFLTWVDANAAQLAQRRLLIPERFRTQSVRVTQGVMRQPLSLQGASAASTFPDLGKQLELVGCAACHTSDAEFVQTRNDRSVSPFYEKELRARALHLAALARGDAPTPPFGPLQVDPVLPP